MDFDDMIARFAQGSYTTELLFSMVLKGLKVRGYFYTGIQKLVSYGSLLLLQYLWFLLTDFNNSSPLESEISAIISGIKSNNSL